MKNIFYFIAIIVVGCSPKDDCKTREPYPMKYDSVAEINNWMIHYHVGDTFTMKKYKLEVLNNKRSYILQGEEIWKVLDSTVKIQVNTTNDWSVCRQQPTTLTIPELQFTNELLYAIYPIGDKYDELRIYFMNKEYRQKNYAFFIKNNFWRDSLIIEGKEYKAVSLIKGWNKGSWESTGAYIDSTYTFFNYDYGLLKFIVNDTLIYQRK